MYNNTINFWNIIKAVTSYSNQRAISLSIISLEDFNSFLRRPQTFSIQAVSNCGSVYTLEKLPHFDAVSAIKKYIITLDKIYEILSDEDEIVQAIIERIIENFLLSLNENGFLYRRWEK